MTAPVRSVRLRVIGGSVELRDDVPSSRAECVDGPRPCPHIKCRWHLWLVEGHDRRGRPPKKRPPESTLRPVWLEWPLPPSCALDVAEAMLPGNTKASEDHSTTQIGLYLGIGREQVRLIIRRAVEKLAAHRKALGGKTPPG